MFSTRTRIIPVMRNIIKHQVKIDKPRFNTTLTTNFNSNNLTNPPATTLYYHTPIRHKGKSSKKQQKPPAESESEQESEIEEEIVDKTSKVMTIRLGSLRLDGVIKSALGIARNKIEVLFYESKIRLNGEKVLKKSVTVQVGDEIDVIKGFSPSNDKFLVVARVEVLNAAGEDEHISLKVRRCKTLTIDNYEVPYKASGGSS